MGGMSACEAADFLRLDRLGGAAMTMFGRVVSMCAGSDWRCTIRTAGAGRDQTEIGLTPGTLGGRDGAEVVEAYRVRVPVAPALYGQL
jgi:hypothetical protein